MSAMNNERYLTDENTQLRAENHRLRTIIEACDVEQARLKERIAELEQTLQDERREAVVLARRAFMDAP